MTLLDAARALADASDNAHSPECRWLVFDDPCDCDISEAKRSLRAAIAREEERQEIIEGAGGRAVRHHAGA